MADSNITKRALANALQELMLEIPFAKISVANICAQCGMNRKSFYYHFKDKYDLVNWIFDTAFLTIMQDSAHEHCFDQHFETLQSVCDLLYQNKRFYCEALKIKGHNVFSDHLRMRCLPIIRVQLMHLLGDEASDEFNINFFADAMLGTLEWWITNENHMPPEMFVTKLKRLSQCSAEAILQKINQEE